MKIDTRSIGLGYSKDASYFAACWFNMVHANSVDSFRVKVVNPQNCLRELLKNHDIGGTEDKAMVRAEALATLSQDLVLKRAAFIVPTVKLCEVLSGKWEKEKENGPITLMMRYLVKELDHAVTSSYISHCLALLEEILVANTLAAESEEIRFSSVKKITNGLLSTLMDSDASLESLYAVYSQFIVPRRVNGPVAFHRQLSTVKTILTQSSKTFQVVFALDNVTTPKDFPENIGGIRFSQTPQMTIAEDNQDKKSKFVQVYLVENRSRLFASLKIEAKDPRAAGAIAFGQLNDILNLVRFEYESAKVTLPDSFASQTGATPPRILSLPTVVPNPRTAIDGPAFADFVKSINDLVTKDQFSAEGLDRVNSAFRLYRTGLDTSVLENKLMNWWTALEFLVRGGTATGSIGSSIEALVTPVVCNTYLQKHLASYRNVLVDLGVVVKDPISLELINLKVISIVDLYELMKRADMRQGLLDPVADYSYLHEQLQTFLTMLNSPARIKEQNEDHEQRVRWQLQRIWRARCDIVHSAQRKVSQILLCANLEFYLKTTLMSLLKDIRILPTLSGPKEFFDRQEAVYIKLQSELKNGNDSLLKSLLQH